MENKDFVDGDKYFNKKNVTNICQYDKNTLKIIYY